MLGEFRVVQVLIKPVLDVTVEFHRRAQAFAVIVRSERQDFGSKRPSSRSVSLVFADRGTVPLRAERPEDIPLLAGDFLRRFDPAGRTEFSPAAIACLGTQTYPGNVRQLKNLIERLTILCSNRVIDVDDIARHFGSPQMGGTQIGRAHV